MPCMTQVSYLPSLLSVPLQLLANVVAQAAHIVRFNKADHHQTRVWRSFLFWQALLLPAIAGYAYICIVSCRLFH